MSDSLVPPMFDDAPEAPPLAWMLAMLQQAMEEVMEGDATPLQKANTLARLGNLYLKAFGAAGLKQANKELTRRLAELEERLAALTGGADGRDPKGADQPKSTPHLPVPSPARVPSLVMPGTSPAPARIETSPADSSSVTVRPG